MLLPSRVSSRSISSVKVTGFSGEDGGQGVTFSAANVGLGHILLRFSAVSRDFHFWGKDEKETLNAGLEHHMLTGVGLYDTWHWTSGAKFGLPVSGWGGIHQQATFFTLSATIIIPIKIFTLFSGWCTHGHDYSMVSAHSLA